MECLIQNFVILGPTRMKSVFTKAFMQQFQQEHSEACKAANVSEKMLGLDRMGYPDCGNGHYSDKLEYGVWYDFNCKQRAYKNMLEFLTPVVVFLLIGGLELPWVSIGFGLLFIVGRLLYAIGYASAGRP